MDYLDKLEEQRAAHVPPPLPYAPVPPPPGGAALQYATPQQTSQVRAVGLAQRRIMWVILAAILLMFSFVGGAVFMPTDPAFGIAAAVGLVAGRVAIIVLMMIGVYQLAAALGKGTAGRVLYTLLMLVPLLGLILLLVINQEATAMMRRNGIKVGLMGPRVADLPAA